MWTRTPLLGLLVENPEHQTRKFFQKREVSPEDASRFRERVGETGKRLLGRLTYAHTPDNLSYPSSAEIQKRTTKQKGPNFFATVDHNQRKPLARTLRFMHRSALAAGGRPDENAAKIGYMRLSFHPDDDEQHGNTASDRSRMTMNHIVKHFPGLNIEHHRDELNDGRHTHHLEIAHNEIPSAITHLRAWTEVLDDVLVLTSAAS